MKALYCLIAVGLFSMGWTVRGCLPIECSEEKGSVVANYDIARTGIEAGIYACLSGGLPTNRVELDTARQKARSLIERLYPAIKWKWPPLQSVVPTKGA